MRPVGFSTGALALGDFRHALAILGQSSSDAVELSALRVSELSPLVDGAAGLDLHQFRHVSVHAPSHFSAKEEAWVAQQLLELAERGWPVVLHPDTISDDSFWRPFEGRLLIENMDKRKRVGRTAAELDGIFDRFPNAGLCFDIAHARQFDSSMTEAYAILRAHAGRLRQVHMSEVNTASRHARISAAAEADFREVVHLIPAAAPIILESQVSQDQVVAEIRRAIRLVSGPGAAHQGMIPRTQSVA